MNFIHSAWAFEYALLPCLFAYFFFELPIIYRRITRKLYVPVYFAFFPFGFSDELYAKYFDEDLYYIVGGPYSEKERPNARIRIIWLSMLSLLLSVIVSPFSTALFCYYFLTESQFIQFAWTLFLVKAVLLTASLYNLGFKYKVTDLVPIQYIAVIYFVYLCVIMSILFKSKDWIALEIQNGGIAGLALSLFDFIVFDIGFYILFVALISWLIPWRLTQADEKIDVDET